MLLREDDVAGIARCELSEELIERCQALLRPWPCDPPDAAAVARGQGFANRSRRYA